MTYKITEYTKQRAEQLGLRVEPSKNPKKKLDVYDSQGRFMSSIGALNMSDFPSYINSKGLEYALKRRKLFYERHKNNNNLSGLLAKALLW